MEKAVLARPDLLPFRAGVDDPAVRCEQHGQSHGLAFEKQLQVLLQREGLKIYVLGRILLRAVELRLYVDRVLRPLQEDVAASRQMHGLEVLIAGRKIRTVDVATELHFDEGAHAASL